MGNNFRPPTCTGRVWCRKLNMYVPLGRVCCGKLTHGSIVVCGPWTLNFVTTICIHHPVRKCRRDGLYLPERGLFLAAWGLGLLKALLAFCLVRKMLASLINTTSFPWIHSKVVQDFIHPQYLHEGICTPTPAINPKP